MSLVIDNVVVEGLLDHSAERFVPTITVVSASTLTLTVASTLLQFFTGSVAGQIVKLPDATTLTPGYRYELWNQSSQNLTVQDSASGALAMVGASNRMMATLQAAGSAAGVWAYAILEQNPTALQQFLVTYPGTGLSVNYSGGIARFNATTTQVAAGTLLLTASVTNGWIYVDIDGTVKSAATLPVNVMPLAQFTTSGSAVTVLTDMRDTVEENLVWGTVSDIVAETYNRAASAGTLEKYARADHAHLNSSLLFRSGVVAAGAFAGNPKKATVVFTTALPSATYSVKITSTDSRVCTYETRLATGFTINLNANTAPSNDVSWEATITGESA